jgi:hypothetical protein
VAFDRAAIVGANLDVYAAAHRFAGTSVEDQIAPMRDAVSAMISGFTV